MNKLNNDIKLYNLIFPTFMLFVFVPILWQISLVGNFIIDSVVLIIISLIIYHKLNWKFYIKSIFFVYIFGFFSDIIGVFYLIATAFLTDAEYYEGNDLVQQILSGIYMATSHSHFDSFWSFAFITSGIIISMVMIFGLNYLFSFIFTDLTKKQKLLSALSFAIFTAPYAFLLPNELFYG